MRRIGRALLVVALLLGVYVLAAGIALGLVVLAVVAIRHGLRGALAGELIGLSALTTIGLLVAVLQRSKNDEQDRGTVLTMEEQPRLMAEVAQLAATVGTRPPDEVRLLPDVNAAVTERSHMLGLVPGKRTLFLGAPLLMGLTRQQLRSVLAHELGHYSGRHTALGGVTYRGREALDRIVERFGHKSVIGRIFGVYARLYWALTFAVSRQQELEADDFSVEVAGRDTATAALTELPLLSAAWEHYFEQFVVPVHAAGRRPSEFFDGFAEILRAPRLQAALASFRTDFDEKPKTRYDSHPPLSARVARLRKMPRDAVALDPTPALGLLEKPQATLLDLQEWMYRDSNLEAAPWADLLRGHQPAEIRARAEVLYRVAGEAEHHEVSLGTVVGSLRGRQLSSWVRPHLADPSGEQIRQTSRELVQSVVDEALMTLGGARFSLAWDEEPRFVDRSGTPLDSRRMVERAIDSGDPRLLSDWLLEFGVTPDYTPSFTVVDPREELRSEPARVLEALAPIAGHRKLFCIVLNHGVLLRRPTMGDHLTYWTGGRNPGRLLLARMLSRCAQELLDEGDNVWMPWDRIVSVHVGRGRTRRPKLTFACTDGTTWVVKYRMHTRDSGEALQALEFFLTDRVLA